MNDKGMTINQAIREYDDVELLQYLHKEIVDKGNHEKVMEMDVDDNDYYNDECTTLMLALELDKSVESILKLIEIGGQELVVMGSYNGRTALHYACKNRNISIDVITKLIEVGGREMVVMVNSRKETALHYACKNRNVSVDIITKLIDVGGRELVVMETKKSGDTALHYACKKKKVSIDIVAKLVKAGGRGLVMAKDRFGLTALYYECQKNYVSADIIKKLIEVGGPELVMANPHYNGTALHCVMKKENVSIDIISKFIDVGGKELLMEKDGYGRTVLHCACEYEFEKNSFIIDIISKIIEIGGPEIVMERNDFGDTILHSSYFVRWWGKSPKNNDILALLLKESILSHVGGEFGIGGLFNAARQEVQNKIYEKWEELLPALKSTLESLHEEQRPLILHAAIIAKAPLHIIQGITTQFEYSFMKTDSLHRYPVEVALEKDLSWKEGLQHILKRSVLIQQQQYPTKIVSSAAQYGLKWIYQMKELVEVNADGIMNNYDGLTGLRLFMVAAIGNSHDLSSIYGMMKMCPETINILE